MVCLNFVAILQYCFLNLITDDMYLMAYQNPVTVNDHIQCSMCTFIEKKSYKV